MTKKELIMAAIEKMGYSTEIDEDGDIMFQYQMKTLYAMTSDNEEDQYISLLLPRVNEVEEGEEPLVLAVCNKMNRELKIMKVFIDNTFKNVGATYEFNYANEESLELNLTKALDMMGVVRTLYRHETEELSEE